MEAHLVVSLCEYVSSDKKPQLKGQVRDRQIAISTGTPMVINDQDHDVEGLVEQDFAEEAPETVQYIISQVKLSKASKIFRAPKPDRLPLVILTE